MLLSTSLLAAHFIGVTAQVPPPPKPPPSTPSLATSTSLLTASTTLAPLRNPVMTSTSGYSIALYDQMAVIGDPSSSTMMLQTLSGDSNTWQEVAYVNVTSITVSTPTNTSEVTAATTSSTGFVEVAQSLALSERTILVSKVSKIWDYTEDCPEDTCQAAWYDTECCPLLTSTDAVSLLVYSYDTAMNVKLTQELSLALSSASSPPASNSSNSSSTSSSEEDYTRELSTTVTDIHTYFTASDSFYTSVSWTVTNFSVYYSDDASEDEGGMHSYSHSQIFFGTLFSAAESSSSAWVMGGFVGYEEEEEVADTLIASWDKVSSILHQESTTTGENDDSQDKNSMLAAVAVYEAQLVQGFCNHSSLAQGAGVVFFYSSEETAADTGTDTGAGAGADEWHLVQTLYPTVIESANEDVADDDMSFMGAHFGSAVALQSNTLAVGAYGLECVFLYSFNQSMAGWQLHSAVYASDGVTGTLFGFSLQLLTAHQLVVGAPLSLDANGVQSGAVFQYGYLTDLQEWTELSKAEAANASSGSCFGSTLEAVKENLFLVAAFPSAVMKRGGASVGLTSSSSSPTHQVYSLNFTDCATYTSCVEAAYNATSNVTTPEVCTTYSTCSEGDQASDTSSRAKDSNQVLYVILLLGATILLLPVVLLGVSMMRQRLQARRGEYLDDNSNDNQAAPVLRMTPLNTLEEGRGEGSSSSSAAAGAGVGVGAGGVGESPVGRPPLVGAQKKGRGSTSYSSLTSQMQVEPSSPASHTDAAPLASSSSSTVGGLLNKLRSNLGGSGSVDMEAKDSSSASLSAGAGTGVEENLDHSDINSPSGPPRLLGANKKSPFIMPAVEE